jgi:PTH1 family peptidyl-tRNA hydrolase
MWLVIGLGNPGSQYALTRHNIGFMAVDLLATGLGLHQWGQEHKAWTAKTKLEKENHTEQILLVKPQTYMNLSGTSVQALMAFYKIPLDHILVLQDDIDQPFGSMRFHKNRGHGGHNGIRNISELMGSDYARLKLGVGRPLHPEMSVADYVLQKFSPEEQSKMPDFLNKAGDAVEAFIFDGLAKASTKFNG